MKRMRDLKGMPILSLREGERLGQVRDLIIDPAAGQVVALLLDKRSAGREEQVIATANVHNVGESAITVQDRSSVVPLARIARFRELAKVRKPIPGKQVVTEGGNHLGRVADLQIDPQTFHLLGLELQGRLMGGGQVIPAEHIRSIGPDVIVVRESFTEEVQPSPPQTPGYESPPQQEEAPFPPGEPAPSAPPVESAPEAIPTGPADEAEPAVPPVSTLDERRRGSAPEGEDPEGVPEAAAEEGPGSSSWQRWVRKLRGTEKE